MSANHKRSAVSVEIHYQYDYYPTEEQKAANTEWLVALRGDNYKQGRFYLKSSEGYCCLGVDCKVAGIDESVLNGFQFEANGSLLNYEAYPSVTWFRERHGFRVDDLSFTVKGKTRSIPQLNDDDEFTFAQIATVLESFFNGVMEVEV